MNTQEIFRNMTKTPWAIETLLAAATISNFHRIADRLAAISAVDNTWNKGINPESVEKLKDALERIMGAIEIGAYPSENALNKAKEALTEAKL